MTINGPWVFFPLPVPAIVPMAIWWLRREPTPECLALPQGHWVGKVGTLTVTPFWVDPPVTRNLHFSCCRALRFEHCSLKPLKSALSLGLENEQKLHFDRQLPIA